MAENRDKESRKYHQLVVEDVPPVVSNQMSLVLRKRVLGVSDQVRHKPSCAVIEDG